MGLINWFKNAVEEDKAKQKAKEEMYISYAQGNLPEILSSRLMLKKGEKCHFEGKCARVVSKTRTKYQTQSAGVSFRIAKGVSIGNRQSETVPIKTQVHERYEGTLYLTNKRIVFLSSEKGIDISFSRINGIEPYKDAIEIFSGTQSVIFMIKDTMEIRSIIQGIGEKYYSE